MKNVIFSASNTMYPFMKLDDNTEIVHSEMLKDGHVKAYIEKTYSKDVFHRATCYLLSYTREEVFFPDGEFDRYKKVIASTAHLIM